MKVPSSVASEIGFVSSAGTRAGRAVIRSVEALPELGYGFEFEDVR